MAPMLGFKGFKTAAVTIAGIEPLLIRKGQFNLRRPCLGIDVRLLSGLQSRQPGKVTPSHAHGHNPSLVMRFAPARPPAVPAIALSA